MDFWIDYLLPPGSILVLLLLAALAWRWPGLRRGLVAAAVLLFVISSLPFVGAWLSSPLAGAARPYDQAVDGAVLAIVVPTGGIYKDAQGRWWPSESSVLRATLGLRVQRSLGVPLIVTGGAPLPDRPPEAEILSVVLRLDGPQVELDTSARNTAESGLAVAALLPGAPPRRVIVVTGPTHLARMSAVLRHQGFDVFAPPEHIAGAPPEAAAPWLSRVLPSYRGLKQTRAALWEYLGIAWYWVRGDIALDDLWPGEPATPKP